MRNQYKTLQSLYESVDNKNQQREIQKIIDTCRKLASGYIKLLNSSVPGKQLLNYKQNSINPVLQYILSYIEHSTPQEKEKFHNYLTELMATVWLEVDPSYWEQEMHKLISGAVIYGEVDLDNLEDLALEMNRREFLKKTSQGLTAAGIMPGSVGNALSTLGTVGNATKAVTNYLPDDVVMSLFNLGNFDTKGVSRVKLISQLTRNKNKLTLLNNFLQNNIGSVGEIYIEGLIDLLGLGINVFSGKWTVEDRYLGGHWDFELERLTPSYFHDLLGDQVSNNDELFFQVFYTLFEKNAISPELQLFLEERYRIYKCDYMEDPASKNRKFKEQQDVEKQNTKPEEKEDYSGSKFDWAGGDWDRHNNYGGPGTYTIDEDSDKEDAMTGLNSILPTLSVPKEEVNYIEMEMEYDGLIPSISSERTGKLPSQIVNVGMKKGGVFIYNGPAANPGGWRGTNKYGHYTLYVTNPEYIVMLIRLDKELRDSKKWSDTTGFGAPDVQEFFGELYTELSINGDDQPALPGV